MATDDAFSVPLQLFGHFYSRLAAAAAAYGPLAKALKEKRLEGQRRHPHHLQPPAAAAAATAPWPSLGGRAQEVLTNSKATLTNGKVKDN
jgi:hypothetical protein